MTKKHDYELIYVDVDTKLPVPLAITVYEPPSYSGLITKLELSRKDGMPLQRADVRILERTNDSLQNGQSILNPRPRIEFRSLTTQSQLLITAEIAVAGKHHGDSRFLANEVCCTLEDMGAKDALINNRIARSMSDGRSR